MKVQCLAHPKYILNIKVKILEYEGVFREGEDETKLITLISKTTYSNKLICTLPES